MRGKIHNLFLRFVRFVFFLPVGIESQTCNYCPQNDKSNKKYCKFVHYYLPPLSNRYPKNTNNKNANIPRENLDNKIFSGVINLPIITILKIICAKLKKNFAKFSFLRLVNSMDIIPPFDRPVNCVIIKSIQKLCEFFVNGWRVQEIIKVSSFIRDVVLRELSRFAGMFFNSVLTNSNYSNDNNNKHYKSKSNIPCSHYHSPLSKIVAIIRNRDQNVTPNIIFMPLKPSATKGPSMTIANIRFDALNRVFAKFSLCRLVSFINIIPLFLWAVNIARKSIQNLCEFFVKVWSFQEIKDMFFLNVRWFVKNIHRLWVFFFSFLAKEYYQNNKSEDSKPNGKNQNIDFCRRHLAYSSLLRKVANVINKIDIRNAIVKINTLNFSTVINWPITKAAITNLAMSFKVFANSFLCVLSSFIDIIPLLKRFVNCIINIIQKLCEFFVKVWSFQEIIRVASFIRGLIERGLSYLIGVFFFPVRVTNYTKNNKCRNKKQTHKNIIFHFYSSLSAIIANMNNISEDIIPRKIFGKSASFGEISKPNTCVPTTNLPISSKIREIFSFCFFVNSINIVPLFRWVVNILRNIIQNLCEFSVKVWSFQKVIWNVGV